MAPITHIRAKEDEKGSRINVPEIVTALKDSKLSDDEIEEALSDTQILKVRGERSYYAPTVREEWSSEVIAYYE